MPAYGGVTYIADKSAWVRANDPAVAAEWTEALEAGQIGTCSITILELLYSARSAGEFSDLEEELAILPSFETGDHVIQLAIDAMRELAQRGAGYHRVKLPDAIIAASAVYGGVGVLHYDHHYDRLAEVLDFDSRWIAAAGSID